MPPLRPAHGRRRASTDALMNRQHGELVKPVLKAIVRALFVAVLAPATSLAAPPDPMARGPYAPVTLDPLKIGTVDLQEPNAAGGGRSGTAAAATGRPRGATCSPAYSE